MDNKGQLLHAPSLQGIQPLRDAVADPFDDPLNMPDDLWEFTAEEPEDTPIIIEDKCFEYLKPPYMLFDDQLHAKQKLREAFEQRLFLLLYGYSGSGKTTMLKQFASRFPEYVIYFDDFTSRNPVDFITQIGLRINQPLKQRNSEVNTLARALRLNSHRILLFDEVSIINQTASLMKLETLRNLYMHSGVPIVICGTQKLYRDLTKDNAYDDYCALLSRMDEYKMEGMRASDAHNFLTMMTKDEKVAFTIQAREILVPIAVNKKMGGIRSFVTIIGRAVTHARAEYYTTGGRTIPDNARCVRPKLPGNGLYPGASVIYTLPVTPDVLTINEYLVASLLANYKTRFPGAKKKTAVQKVETNDQSEQR